jgi:L-amino acid N-acyltransferase YncA
VSLSLLPVTLREARAFVAKHHRHHRPPQGGLFAVGVEECGHVRGVAIVGKPVARMLADDFTAEVTRLCTDGHRNACSMLYAAAWRAARALGYRRLLTYTLAEEGGASLKAAGWKLIGEAGGGSWSRKERPRVDTHPTQQKLRWEAA